MTGGRRSRAGMFDVRRLEVRGVEKLTETRERGETERKRKTKLEEICSGNVRGS